MGFMQDHQDYILKIAKAARKASQQLAGLRGEVMVAALEAIAAAIRGGREALLAANALDVTAAQKSDLQPALVERLKLNDKRIISMADGVEQIAGQIDPVGQIIEGYVRPNGLRISKVRVPLGVVLFFYESRPNVTSDAAALCLKSGNAIILRGGKECINSNLAIAKIIGKALADSGIDPNAVQLIESTDRALVPPLLKMDKYIDLVIPRGGESLIRAVVSESTIPVLKHFTGNCHIYLHADATGMADMARTICVNAKTSYPGGAVCNAVEKLIFHKDTAAKLLPVVCEDLAKACVEIRGDERAKAVYPAAKAATDADWSLEYLSLTIAIKVVDSIEDAIAHINEYGSHHTDAIISNDKTAIERFTMGVDSASIMINTSTRFADGGAYGLGAEIGISTDKLHARGPMGAADLTTYKWVVMGDGQVR
jgi:glutamate-5-semialdehyde dehydrogenase